MSLITLLKKEDRLLEELELLDFDILHECGDEYTVEKWVVIKRNLNKVQEKILIALRKELKLREI